MAATTGTRQLSGNQEGDGSEGPAGPPATPTPGPCYSLGAWGHRPSLGRAAGHWRRLEGLGTVGREGRDRPGLPPGMTPLQPRVTTRAHLWPAGGPAGLGLFSPSVVWRGWRAPGAGTEVAGSLVALWRNQWGCHQRPARHRRPEPTCRQGGGAEPTQTPGADPDRSSRLPGICTLPVHCWLPRTPPSCPQAPTGLGRWPWAQGPVKPQGHRDRPGRPPRAPWGGSGAGAAPRARLQSPPSQPPPPPLQKLLPSRSPVQGAGGRARPSEGGREIPDADQGLTGGCMEEGPGDMRLHTPASPGHSGCGVWAAWAAAHLRALRLCCRRRLPEVQRGVQGPGTWEAREAARGGSWGRSWSLGEPGPGAAPQQCLLASPELQGAGGRRASWAWGRDAEGSLRGKGPRARLLLPGVLGAGQGVCRHWVKGGCPAGAWGRAGQW